MTDPEGFEQVLGNSAIEDAGALVVDPRGGLLRHLRAFDLQLVSRPDASFSGWVEIAGERAAVEARGLLCHYWGRRLPATWHWVSANVPGVIVDAAFMQSRLWGLPWVRLGVGYVFIQAGGRRIFHVCPLNAVVRARGGHANFTIEAWRPGQRFILDCRGEPGGYNDLGLGILQTLRGDCVVAGVAALSGKVGLEARSTRS